MKNKKISVPLLLVVLISQVSLGDSYFEMKSDWKNTEKIEEQFQYWMSTKSSERIYSEYGNIYSFKIPYYETFGALDFQKKYPYPYGNDFSYVEKTFNLLCKRVNGHSIRVTQSDASIPKFDEFDPSTARVVPKHFPACKAEDGNISVIVLNASKINERFTISFYSKVDYEKYISSLNQRENENREWKAKQHEKEMSKRASVIENFRKTVKVGDYCSIGLIVEIKPPLANIQTSNGMQWIRLDELMPPEHMAM